MILQITFILFFLLIYLLGGLIAADQAKSFFSDYQGDFNNLITIDGKYCFFAENGKVLTIVCTWLWPLFLAYKHGKFIGEQVYEILTDDKDEYRLASWVF